MKARGGRSHAPPPPPNGRRDRDEDLLLFREMQKREKDGVLSLLQPVSEEFDPNGNYSLYRIAPAKKGAGYELLTEGGKNDYDWLKTPPATPLFPSLEMEGNAPELAVQRELPIIQPLPQSRFSGNSKASNAGRMPKSPIPLSRLVNPNILLGETTKKTEFNQKKNIDDFNKKSSNRMIGGSSARTPSQNPNFPKNPIKDPRTSPKRRGVSPLVRSSKVPYQIPGFSNETPPNLRTNRSASATRGRSVNTTQTANQKLHSTCKIERQSCSPSTNRDREGNNDENKTGQKEKIQTGNGTLVLGSRMVEKLMNARKSAGEERKIKPKSRGFTNDSSYGFGRMVSKTSMDMAFKHMDIKRDPVTAGHSKKF